MRKRSSSPGRTAFSHFKYARPGEPIEFDPASATAHTIRIAIAQVGFAPGRRKDRLARALAHTGHDMLPEKAVAPGDEQALRGPETHKLMDCIN